MQRLVTSINDDSSRKSLTINEKACLINSERFLLLSGQSSYFSEQKAFLQKEINRLQELYNTVNYKLKDATTRRIELEMELSNVDLKYRQKIDDILREVCYI